MSTWESVDIQTKGKTGRFYVVCPKCSSDRKKKNIPCLTVNDEVGNRWWKCFSGETGVITINGTFSIKSLSGRNSTLLTSNGWVNAPIKSFGIQKIWELNLIRDGVKKIIKTTEYHEWMLSNRVNKIRTKDLKPNDILKSSPVIFDESIEMDPEGIRHGFTFGDGSLRRKEARAYFIGEKQEMMQYFNYTTTYKRDDCVTIPRLPFHYKSLPNIKDSSKEYLYGFLAGWFAADGSVCSRKVEISSSKKENLLWFKDAARKIGIKTGEVLSSYRLGGISVKKWSFIYGLTLRLKGDSFILRSKHQKSFIKPKFERSKWRVVNVVESSNYEEVFCAVVDGVGNFTIEGDILTGNCAHCSWSGNLDAYDKYDKVREKARMPATPRQVYSPAVMEKLFIPKGISANTAIQAKIFEIGPWSEEKFGQVAFPFYFQGNLVNVKYRRLHYGENLALSNGTERYLSKNWQLKKEDGAKVCYWGLEMLNFEENQDLIITEGETDRLTWMECGFTNILSVPNGAINEGDTNIQDKLAFAVDEWVMVNVYPKVKRFFIATDDDGPGKRLASELAAIYGKNKSYVVKYKGRKDINEVLVGVKKEEGGFEALGKQGVIDCFELATPYPVGGILTFDLIAAKIEEMSLSGFKRGHTLGGEHVVGVDKYISVAAPYVATITGIPGMGKSSFWRWYMTEQSNKNNLRWGLFVPDSRPEEREITKICEIIGGAKWERNKPWSMSDAARNRARDFVKEYFYLIKPDRHNAELLNRLGREDISVRSLDGLKYYFETLKRQYNIFGYEIDAWNKIEHQKPNGINDEAFVSKQLDYILTMNQELELFGSIVAHPTKLERIKGSRNYDAPDLYNVKGSSAWFEKSDIGITIHRQKFKRVAVGTEGRRTIYKEFRDNSFPTQIIINKIKQAEIGEEGEFEMYMDWKKAETFIYERPSYYDEDANNEFIEKVEADHATPIQKSLVMQFSSEGDSSNDFDGMDNAPF